MTFKTFSTTMTNKEIYQLIQDSAVHVSEHPYIRLGQAMVNILFARNRAMYEDVVTSRVDPFYNDKKIAEFLEFLEDKKDLTLLQQDVY